MSANGLMLAPGRAPGAAFCCAAAPPCPGGPDVACAGVVCPEGAVSCWPQLAQYAPPVAGAPQLLQKFIHISVSIDRARAAAGSGGTVAHSRADIYDRKVARCVPSAPATYTGTPDPPSSPTAWISTLPGSSAVTTAAASSPVEPLDTAIATATWSAESVSDGRLTSLAA